MTTVNTVLIYLSRRSSTLRLRASVSSITGIPSRTGKARASALQTSSDLSSATFNGPLHRGQARISRSFGSMAQSLEKRSVGRRDRCLARGGSGQQRGQTGVEPGEEGRRRHGIHGQVPPVGSRKGAAFHGIL